MTKFHENEDRTTAEAERYRYLFTPTLAALPVTESESGRIENRAIRTGNRREVFIASWTARGLLLLVVLASVYAGMRIERARWLAPDAATASP